ncbi:MAG: GNAT family acetyltransferase [Dehalococcoidales bacterium]|nr:GNAT family acetyltransferase [Dehalococcoidales bacterium]
MNKTTPGFTIRPYAASDQTEVIALWQKSNLLRPWNNPQRDIARKLTVNPELFLVGVIEGIIVASVIGGYEGHRGWVNYLAVDPAYRKRGLGKQIMNVIADKLLSLGCPKINLQVRADNFEAMKFYEKIGYTDDHVVSYGKRLIRDD